MRSADLFELFRVGEVAGAAGSRHRCRPWRAAAREQPARRRRPRDTQLLPRTTRTTSLDSLDSSTGFPMKAHVSSTRGHIISTRASGVVGVSPAAGPRSPGRITRVRRDERSIGLIPGAIRRWHNTHRATSPALFSPKAADVPTITTPSGSILFPVRPARNRKDDVAQVGPPYPEPKSNSDCRAGRVPLRSK